MYTDVGIEPMFLMGLDLTRALIKEFKGVRVKSDLVIELAEGKAATSISGVEVIAEK